MKRRDPNPIDPRAIALMAEQALAGGVVQPASIPELCALLDVLRSRGYELKRRTEWEQHAAPWLLIVVPIYETTRVAATGVSTAGASTTGASTK